MAEERRAPAPPSVLLVDSGELGGDLGVVLFGQLPLDVAHRRPDRFLPLGLVEAELVGLLQQLIHCFESVVWFRAVFAWPAKTVKLRRIEKDRDHRRRHLPNG